MHMVISKNHHVLTGKQCQMLEKIVAVSDVKSKMAFAIDASAIANGALCSIGTAMQAGTPRKLESLLKP